MQDTKPKLNWAKTRPNIEKLHDNKKKVGREEKKEKDPPKT